MPALNTAAVLLLRASQQWPIIPATNQNKDAILILPGTFANITSTPLPAFTNQSPGCLFTYLQVIDCLYILFCGVIIVRMLIAARRRVVRETVEEVGGVEGEDIEKGGDRDAEEDWESEDQEVISVVTVDVIVLEDRDEERFDRGLMWLDWE